MSFMWALKFCLYTIYYTASDPSAHSIGSTWDFGSRKARNEPWYLEAQGRSSPQKAPGLGVGAPTKEFGVPFGLME